MISGNKNRLYKRPREPIDAPRKKRIFCVTTQSPALLNVLEAYAHPLELSTAAT